MKCITLKSNSISSRYTLKIVLLLLYVPDNIQYIMCVRVCVCAYVCVCVCKRLVVASQWTCCYADALLFRIG